MEYSDKTASLALRPAECDVRQYTDTYFKKTKEVVGKYGDVFVTYAVFMRRPVISSPKLAVDWLTAVATERGAAFEIELTHPEGHWVGAGEPLLFLSGSLYHLVDLETLYLQKLGAACVAAYNAFEMCKALPMTAFLAMDARHCAGTDMAELMAYGASVGSKAARDHAGAVGFIGNATDATAHYFDQVKGYGTMPHALIGYAGSTVKAAQMFHDTHPGESMTVLVDYYGDEIQDSLEVARSFRELAEDGRLALRLDTHSGRYIEGLDPQTSYEVIDRNAPEAIRQFRTETELKHLVGTGVSSAAIWYLREHLNVAGFDKVKIVASSGFDVEKCRAMAGAKTPIDLIGTGSFLPSHWPETYATADIIEYNGKKSVKIGREFLLRQRSHQKASS